MTNPASGALFLIGVLAISGCSAPAPSPPVSTPPASRAWLANPASDNCIATGGEVKIETTGSGGQYGVCLFEDNRQCEEWALLRGACPAGGIKVTGYITPQARYCAIRGGDYAVARQQTGSTPEQGICTLPGEPACDALALYEGRCS